MTARTARWFITAPVLSGVCDDTSARARVGAGVGSEVAAPVDMEVITSVDTTDRLVLDVTDPYIRPDV